MKLRSTVCCAVIAVIAALAGCAAIPRQTEFMKSVPGVNMSTSELREHVIELGRRESALVEEAVVDVRDGTTDPAAWQAALSWGLAALPDVQEAALNADPLVAFADLWALALQTEAFARNGPGRKRLLEGYIFVERAARDMAKECEKVAALVFGAQDVPRLRGRVQAWVDKNPITAGTFARPTASVAPGLAQAANEQPRSARAFIASTEDRLALLDARMEMLNKTMLSRIRWTSVLLIQEALGTDDVAQLIRSLEAFVGQEREQIVQDLDRERKLVFANLDGQREAAFGDISKERAAIFKQISGERTAIMTEADQLLQKAQADARGLVDRTLIRVGVGAAVLILLAALAFWVVWHFSRGPRSPRGHAHRRPTHLGPASAPTG